jgi:hypothetical protein
MTLWILGGAVLGGGIGFGWHKRVGCPTGSCPLTRNPFLSTLYGMILGALMAGSFH